eukprot:12907794-Prorocentrum_lima.AAC.1
MVRFRSRPGPGSLTTYLRLHAAHQPQTCERGHFVIVTRTCPRATPQRLPLHNQRNTSSHR